MGKLILLIAIGFGAWQLLQGNSPFSAEAGAFDDADRPLVYLFTIDNCGKPCEMGRNDLKRRRVDYRELPIDINNDDDENTRLWNRFRSNNRLPLIVAGSEKLVGANRPEIAGILGMNYGDKYLSNTEKRYFRQHFYADGSPRVVIYGADWCGYCAKLREELDAGDVDFIEIDVEKSGEQKRMSETMGVYGYPTTWVGYARVQGIDLKAVKAAMRRY